MVKIKNHVSGKKNRKSSTNDSTPTVTYRNFGTKINVANGFQELKSKNIELLNQLRLSR